LFDLTDIPARLRGPLGALALIVVVAVAASCATPPTSGASATAGASAGGSAGAPILLQRLAPQTGCDAIGVDYRKITIRIDPSAEIQVWADTDKGTQLAIRWAEGFTAEGTPPVIRGPKGEEVARDGTVLEIPDGAYPRLAGYFVCPGVNSVGVYAEIPA
jgi:hypothetical protein